MLSATQHAEEVQSYAVFVRPTICVLHADGRTAYRWDGSVPPSEYLPVVLLGKAHFLMQRKEWDSARELLDHLRTTYPASPFRPEVLFWYGVSLGRSGAGNADSVMAIREEILTRYPDSPWALHYRRD